MKRNTTSNKNILWWGRFDPNYSRNRILRSLLLECGYSLQDFIPRSSFLAPIEAVFTSFDKPAALWVPAFRQRDYSAARRFADRHSLPLIFDPLISAWDKAVFERNKFSQNSSKSRRLLAWEQSLFSRADLVIADTDPDLTEQKVGLDYRVQPGDIITVQDTFF